jgi:hypothetical protein
MLRSVVAATVLFCASVSFTTAQTTEDVKVENVKIEKKVLLASEKTNFKDDLIKEMNALLTKDAIVVTTKDHSDSTFQQEDAANYDAIFITNSGVNSKVRPWVMEWIDKNSVSAKKILLHTTKKGNWKIDVPVDAVSSASVNKDAKKMALEYVGKIKSMLEQK